MNLKTFLRGIHLREEKELAEKSAIRRVLPEGEMVYPLSQHIGAPAKPVVAPGDRVLAGVGPEVDWDGWETFVPETTPGLCCVQYVHPKYLAGTPCHLEAGGWWTRTGSGAHSLTN